jgi:hypothetical protein
MWLRLLQLVFGALFFADVTGQDAIVMSSPSRPGSGMVTAPPGPWGSLEYYEVTLEGPRGIHSMLKLPSQQVEWFLPAASRAELKELLIAADLTESEISDLLSGSKLIQDLEAFRIFPAEATVLNIPTPTRVKLYHLLSKYEENRFHQRPVYINSSNLSDWFEGTGISRSAIQDIATLVYPTPSGRGYHFSDAPFTLKQAGSVIEEQILFQGLFRKRGLIVRLRVSADKLTHETADYWTANYKNKAVMPLLESIVQNNDGGAIDIAHLLPSTPRTYLNRFPDPSDGLSGRFPDWFWTCYNFFRFVPRDVYADSPVRDSLILQEFETGLPPSEFGDLLLFNSGGKVVHGCIHIAEDIVFTKNGADLNSPWVFMKIQDVVGIHDLYGDVSISTFRKRKTSVMVTP